MNNYVQWYPPALRSKIETYEQFIDGVTVAPLFVISFIAQPNCFQSLDLSVEELIDGQENENTKKKT